MFSDSCRISSLRPPTIPTSVMASRLLTSLEVAANRMCQIVAPRPVPAGCYGLRVRPGKDWEADVERPVGWGLTVVPSDDDWAEWTACTLSGLGGMVCEVEDEEEECHALGGWWPTRSHCVVWADGTASYHRTGDCGKYDLEFIFNAEHDHFDSNLWQSVVAQWEDVMTNREMSERARNHVVACERQHTDPLLLRLLAGESLANCWHHGLEMWA